MANGLWLFSPAGWQGAHIAKQCISAPFFDFELRLLALQLRQSTFGGFGHLLCSLLFSLIQLCLRRFAAAKHGTGYK